MNLLLLGGTRFLGCHLVEAAIARGHRVTTFTRGRSTLAVAGVESLRGGRDPRIDEGLAVLEGRRSTPPSTCRATCRVSSAHPRDCCARRLRTTSSSRQCPCTPMYITRR